MLFTDLKAPVVPKVFCIDASLEAGAVVQAPVPQLVADELWRRAEHRGRSAKLQPPLGCYLRELGFRSSEAEDLELASSLCRPSRPLTEGVLFDFCEVFAGSSTSNLAAAFEERGFTVLRIGLQLGYDLLDPAHRCGIIGLILRRVVAAWQLPGTASYST